MGGEKEKIDMALKPLKDRVVAKVEKPAEKTAGGILLGDTKEKPAYAVVESVGPENAEESITWTQGLLVS